MVPYSLTGHYLLQQLVRNVPLFNLLGSDREEEEVLFLNTDSPSSTVVCGVQGSGKSHSVSCIVESFVMPCPQIGLNCEPMSALVLHYDTCFIKQAAELAYLSKGHSKSPQILVLVSPSSLKTMTKVYHDVNPDIQVFPFFISIEDITVSSMMALMKINTSSGNIPLYMHTILNILRQLGEDFSWGLFEAGLNIFVQYDC